MQAKYEHLHKFLYPENIDELSKKRISTEFVTLEWVVNNIFMQKEEKMMLELKMEVI